MSSYIYMKILESQPRRYDRGIALLSLGQADKVKRQLVAETVEPGTRVLDVGCGTGTAAILAARAGAQVTGIDVSPTMLAVAREKIAAESFAAAVDLIEIGVSGMDRFEDGSFDVVMSTLAFSELSADEQAYVLDQAFRILRPRGLLAVADEARPTTIGARLLHGMVRLPLLLVTFALTQTTTHAVEGLADRVRQAGFRVNKEERTALDSFLYLLASKGDDS